MRKKIAILLMVTACAISGCGKMKHPVPEDGYSTGFAMSATEYTLFLQKELLVLNNILFTRSLMADDVSEGKYEAAKEMENAEESLDQVKTIRDEMTTTMPASGYENDRQNAIDLVEDAVVVLEDYIEGLEDGNTTEIKQNADQLRDCSISASGNANQYYE